MMSSSSNITADVLIGVIRDQCLHKGQNGIRGLSMVFRKMDIDFSKGIVYAELRIATERYGLHMSEGYLSTLFHALDEDNNGWIDFGEFMRALRSPLNDRRVDVIMEVFDHIDVNNDGVLSIEDLKEVGTRGHDKRRHYKRKRDRMQSITVTTECGLLDCFNFMFSSESFATLAAAIK